MKITNVTTEEYGIEVTAETKTAEEVFYVQLVDGEYRSDLGCWITTSDSDGDIDWDDYSDFDIDLIVKEAEDHADSEFNDNYREKEIEFNCAINSCVVVMRINKETDEVELFIEDKGNIGSYHRRYTETGVTFDTEKEAQEYADTFRTNDWQDCSGLYALIQYLQI